MARPTQPPRELTYVPLARIGDDTTFRLRHPGDVSSLARSIAQAGQLFPIEVRPAGDRYQAITGFRRLAALRLLFRDRVLVRIHEGISDEAAALVAAADALDSRALERDELLELRERYRAMGWSTPALEELIGRALEQAEERLEDLAARLQGLPPPDRSIVDEDALEDDEVPQQPSPARPPEPAAGAAGQGAPPEPPAEPPGPQPLAVPRAAAEGPRELTVAELAEDAARRLSLLTQDLATLASHWDGVPEHLRRIVHDQIDYYRQLGAWIERLPGESK